MLPERADAASQRQPLCSRSDIQGRRRRETWNRNYAQEMQSALDGVAPLCAAELRHAVVDKSGCRAPEHALRSTSDG